MALAKLQPETVNALFHKTPHMLARRPAVLYPTDEARHPTRSRLMKESLWTPDGLLMLAQAAFIHF